ncbi:uncharacterized protein N7483_004242 [Penicillium malachiteum]|uniref:uncharacterized protein n=1 Tax=Penicillium malachiteum TaxID=1324776 RepID=UPI002548B631|nr:uncharacterized protein N7483_004242 [Penicillium malachiteum]KAJ5729734.1 hypothetical protein N7483_004242 [Penicillium malachiteum]
MAKAKVQKEPKNSKSHLKARLDYLNQAAQYLFSTTPAKDATKSTINNIELQANSRGCDIDPSQGCAVPKQGDCAPLVNLSRMCASQMRGVSLKTLTRLPVSVKRSFCKHCDTLLVPGVDCSQEIRNSSRGGRKPWADVLEIRCFGCSTVRRFPQTDRRSKKLVIRQKEKQSDGQTTTPSNQNGGSMQP